MRAGLDWPENRPILIAIRRLARRMGLEGLIDAMKIVRQSHPDVLLMIGGKGELAGEPARASQMPASASMCDCSDSSPSRIYRWHMLPPISRLFRRSPWKALV